jgi:hypothetical protein
MQEQYRNKEPQYARNSPQDFPQFEAEEGGTVQRYQAAPQWVHQQKPTPKGLFEKGVRDGATLALRIATILAYPLGFALVLVAVGAAAYVVAVQIWVLAEPFVIPAVVAVVVGVILAVVVWATAWATGSKGDKGQDVPTTTTKTENTMQTITHNHYYGQS